MKLSNESPAAEVEDVDVEGDDVGPRVGDGLRAADDAPAAAAALVDQMRVEHDAVLQALLPGSALPGIQRFRVSDLVFCLKSIWLVLTVYILTETVATRARVKANEIFISGL